jgi:Serpentine type 7TM GPCR chemoreceptor Srw
MEVAVDSVESNLTNSNSSQNMFRTECVIGTSHTVPIFLVGGVGMVLVSLVGIIGNIMSLIVLTRPTMRSSSTNVILISLAICDLVFVTSNLLLDGFRVVFGYFCFWSFYTKVIEPVIFPYIYGIYHLGEKIKLAIKISK